MAALLAPTVSSAQQAPPAPPKATPSRARPRKVKAPVPTVSFPTFEMTPDGGSRLTVQLAGGAVNVTEHPAAGVMTYVLEGTRIDVGNDANALETYYYNTPVQRAKLRAAKKDAELIVWLRADVKPTQSRVNNPDGTTTLQIDFPAGSYLTSDVTNADRPPPVAAAPSVTADRARRRGARGKAPPPSNKAGPPAP